MKDFSLFLDRCTPNQSIIIESIHSWILSFPNLSYKMRYGIPFYDYTSWICYLNPLKTNGVEWVFMQGKLLQLTYPELQDKGRKMVAGIEVKNLDSFDIETIYPIFTSAIELDRQK